MAWRYGLCFGITVSCMLGCMTDENKASCLGKTAIVLVNDTYNGVIRYFNYTPHDIGEVVETFIITTSNVSVFADVSCGVKGYYFNTTLDNRPCPIKIDKEYVKQIFIRKNITLDLFPSSLLQTNDTSAILQFLQNATYCPHNTNRTTTSTTPRTCTSTKTTTAPRTTVPSATSSELQFPHLNIKMANPNLSDGGEVHAKAAVELMSNLSAVIDQMGNESIAAVSVGEVKGIITLIANKTKSEGLELAFTMDSRFATVTGDVGAEFPVSFIIPSEAVDAAQRKVHRPYVGIFSFPPMIEDENKKNIMNSTMFAIEMGTSISNLSSTINITYTNISKGHANLTCTSWNGAGQPSWTRDGCYSVEINSTLTCRCTHLTFFAVLMSTPVDISSSDVKSLTYITYVGCGMSTFFLGIALFMHFALRRSKSTKATKILINLFIAMFMLNLIFLLNEWLSSLNNDPLCIFTAGAMHYFMLCTFTWFAIEAFHLYLQLIKVFNINIRYYMVKILVIGWAFPFLAPSVIFIAGKYGRVTINTTDYQQVHMCWITESLVSYIVNIGYYVAVFIFNFIVFVTVVQRIAYLKNINVGLPTQRSVTKDIFTVAGLCGLLGITWGFAFFSYGPLQIPSYYIFTILNSFQGFFLFLYYYKTNNAGERMPAGRSTTMKSTHISHSAVLKSQ